MSERKSRFADFKDLPDDPALLALRNREVPKPVEAPSARTWPGKLAEEQSRGLEGRLASANKKLQDLENSGCVLLALDPKTIRPSPLANRHELSLRIGDKDFEELKSSLQHDGQILPVAVRAVTDDPAHPYELVSGHRRHEAALLLDAEIPGGFRLRAVLDSAAHDPAQLALHMYLENAARKDLSAFEMGTMFARWLADGIYASQVEIARVTGKDKSTIGNYIAIAELPAEVIAAFRDPRVIAVYWNKALSSACRDQPQQTLARAAKLAKQDPPPLADYVFKFLTAGPAAKTSKARGTKLQDTVRVDDKELFRIVMRGSKWTIDSAQVQPDKRPEFYARLKAYAHEYIAAQLEARK
jgi:ParB/RepB/Spo0J family partition protein